MRPFFLRVIEIFLLLTLTLVLNSCLATGPVDEQINISIEVDNETIDLQLPSGSTVFDALDEAGIELGTYDRIDPPSYALLADNTRVIVTRVQETITIENEIVAFEHQIIRNEALPEGEERLLQAGQNGLEELTYRVIQEGGNDPFRVIINRVILQEPVPEILMVGARGAFVPANFDGVIAYASTGNIWLIEGETGTRRPLVLTGDVDGRVFQLSPDGRWLLFTRSSDGEDGSINSLWTIETSALLPTALPLSVNNVVHFADWAPSESEVDATRTIAYSTVEPRPLAPGWQANNDLVLLTIDELGEIVRRRQILESNPGGQYGWWGTTFSWSPDSNKIAYARADGIGFVDLLAGDLEEQVKITPFQTFGDWAWVPYLNWSPDGLALFFIDHGDPISLESPEASQVFNLSAKPIDKEFTFPLVSQVGMFSSIALSPQDKLPSGETSYRVAFLQAIFPLESESSNYQLVIIDRDGSNGRIIFPPIGEPGIEPNRILWSPDGKRLALMYKNDLWLIDPGTNLNQQLTADGQTIAFDWSP